uniref:Serine-threonine/tyrosine-protein kinase catalytic domain-containing protein n=1 Tax=Tanacetum cinerariifolium TaxID=118510 RepID=A0A6L2LS15_TANCI|nr:serine-threonine/tyrosine-protein kinase catalytic domain-containing protein [Tanacetum cinerariifolium]
MFFSTGHKAESSLTLESLQQPCRQFTFSEIQLATQNFDESLIIGGGGFGKVYKGTIIHNASLLTAAIKRLDLTSNQGAVEFWAEVEMLTKLRHCHLVSLIGYCNDKKEMILVYEYMPHGTLEDHLHKCRTSLPWVRRLNMCIGAARGLDYLHTGTGIKHGVVHHDIKSSNILLHDSWEANISDFGLSKICPKNQQSTYVNTNVKGTFGYLDPDYFYTGKLTRKSDVYAFGVVLFEVLCRKQAVDGSLDEQEWSLAVWAQDSIKEGKLKEIVDNDIKGEISPKCLKMFAHLAKKCLHKHSKRRPTMAEVVVGLESVLSLQEKANKTLRTSGMTLFGRKAPTVLSPSNGENSVVRRSLKSLEIYLRTVGGEEKGLYMFTFDALSVATENFSEANKISQKLFPLMHKGRLQNGQGIAIAQPNFLNMNEQLMNEVSIPAKLEHENLIQLLGYCIKGTQVFLVYDFAPYASLDSLIFDPVCNLLDWNKRYKILRGVARVLLYLHKYAPIQVIHCDIIPENVLLEESWNPKLSGFSRARCFDINETSSIIVDQVPGTIGYIAPEYVKENRLSDKVDVFNFGVLVFETISGRRTYDCISETNKNLQHHVCRTQQEGTSSYEIDGDLTSVSRIIKIALLCIQEDVDDRPTMEEVVRMLHGRSSLALSVPKVPTWIMDDRKRIQIIEKAMQEDHNYGAVDEPTLVLSFTILPAAMGPRKDSTSDDSNTTITEQLAQLIAATTASSTTSTQTANNLADLIQATQNLTLKIDELTNHVVINDLDNGSPRQRSPRRRPSPTRHRSPNHRHPRSPKINIPQFNGSNALDWLFQAKNFFSYYRSLVKNESNLQYSILWVKHYPEFERVSNQVTGLSQQGLRNCFISGLRPDIQAELAIHKPTTLHQAYGLAKLVEDKFQLGAQQKQSYQPKPNFTTVASSSSSTPSTNTNTMPPLLPTPPKQPPTLPFTKLSPDALIQRRKDGLCFKCPEKYFPGHKCSPPQFMIIVDNDSQEEPTDIQRNHLKRLKTHYSCHCQTPHTLAYTHHKPFVSLVTLLANQSPS